MLVHITLDLMLCPGAWRDGRPTGAIFLVRLSTLLITSGDESSAYGEGNVSPCPSRPEPPSAAASKADTRREGASGLAREGVRA